MKITNESGVLYLFSRYHELLGFEDIIKIQTAFPDVYAIRKGSHVTIELEFKASRIATHYDIRGSTVYHNRKEYLEHNDKWWEKVIPWSSRVRFDDERGNLYVERRGKSVSSLKRRSLKSCINGVICWTASEKWRTKLEAEGIEVIELKSRLPELGISKFK